MHIFGVENRVTLTNKATAYSAKLLKKPDQRRAVYACSHLFWADDQEGFRDGERVLLCLKRALKIANAAQQTAVATRGSSGSAVLFIEILNKYLYFFEKGNKHKYREHNPRSDGINHHGNAKREHHDRSSSQSFLQQHVAVHTVPETEKAVPSASDTRRSKLEP